MNQIIVHKIFFVFCFLSAFFLSNTFYANDLLLFNDSKNTDNVDFLQEIPFEERKPVEFSFLNEDGDVVLSRDFRNKIIIVYLWASWCFECIDGMKNIKHITNYIRDYEIDNVIVLPITTDHSILDAERFFSNNKITNLKIFLDNKQSTAHALGAETMPSFFVIDNKGRFAASYFGIMQCEIGCFKQIVKQFFINH